MFLEKKSRSNWRPRRRGRETSRYERLAFAQAPLFWATRTSIMRGSPMGALGGVSHAVLPDLSGLAALVKPELLDLAFASLPLEGERRDSNFINLNVN